MTPAILYDRLLTEVRRAYSDRPAAQAFAPFTNDVVRQEISPYHCKCAEYFAAETDLNSQRYSALQDAILAAGPVAKWRETYKGTSIGADFLDRFGCYSIIGSGGPFTSERLWAWMVYMPARLDYPMHHHPAEELYIVVSGEAIFRRKGTTDEVLSEGASVIHKSNQPHATETLDKPVLCLVFWRNGFGTPPVLTDSCDL